MYSVLFTVLYANSLLFRIISCLICTILQAGDTADAAVYHSLEAATEFTFTYATSADDGEAGPKGDMFHAGIVNAAADPVFLLYDTQIYIFVNFSLKYVY